jgi:hypothetical protein
MDDKSVNDKIVQALGKVLKEKDPGSQWPGEVCHIPCIPNLLGMMTKVSFLF